MARGGAALLGGGGDVRDRLPEERRLRALREDGARGRPHLARAVWEALVLGDIAAQPHHRALVVDVAGPDLAAEPCRDARDLRVARDLRDDARGGYRGIAVV